MIAPNTVITQQKPTPSSGPTTPQQRPYSGFVGPQNQSSQPTQQQGGWNIKY